jgi:hypothetical protein
MPRFISGQRLPWKRYWIPWDRKVRCGYDGRGFLVDPDCDWGKVINSQVRSIDELPASRCVVLSGHPGIGKTTEIQSAIEKISKQCEKPDELFFFHCRSITSVEMLRSETVGHSLWLQARAKQGNVTLIIDGVDVLH